MIKNILRGQLLFVLVFFLISCSKDQEISLEENIIGSWSGEIIFPDTDVQNIILQIDSIQENAVAGSWILSDVPGGMTTVESTGSMKYRGLINETLNFELDRMIDGLLEKSFSAINFIDNSTIKYKHRDIDNTFLVTSELRRQ